MFIDLVRKRRSIRRYTNQPLGESHIATLKETALRSFSSRRIDPWEFIFVTDAGLLQKLARAKHGAVCLEGAALGIVICADSAQSDVWIEDCSVAATMLTFAAEELELGSCWVQIRNRNHSDTISAEAYVREILAIPEHISVASIIAVGNPAEHPEGHGPERMDMKKIHRETYAPG